MSSYVIQTAVTNLYTELLFSKAVLRLSTMLYWQPVYTWRMQPSCIAKLNRTRMQTCFLCSRL